MAGLESGGRGETETASTAVGPLSLSLCQHLHQRERSWWRTYSRQLPTAFIFSLLETYLALHPSHSTYLSDKFSSLLPLLTACGFEPIVWEDFWEPLRDLLCKMGPEEKDGGKRKQGEARLSREGLLAAFNDQETNRCVPEHSVHRSWYQRGAVHLPPLRS
jgi:hypothetical protein